VQGEFGCALIVHSEHPFNAEPPLHRLRAAFITPRSDFYIRSHGAVPRLDAASHRLRVDGLVATPLDLSMRELRGRFPHRTVTAVLQCAGNRRADMHAVRPVSGDPWAAGAIGNARWTGVALADVLRQAGAPGDPALHVAFSSCDEVELPSGGRFRYGASIPMAKALSPEVLLVFAMNGEDLAPEHGFPLRAIVPGYAGVRSPKWLAAVTLQARPSDNPMQQHDYRLLPPDTAEPGLGVAINEMPLNAAICVPDRDAELPPGRIAVKGYAIATARTVTRVDVSADRGRTWRQADLNDDPAAPWSWTFWRTMLDLPPGEHELVARAWDSAGQTQPARAEHVWNVKGYLCAAWHRVPVRVRGG